MHRSLNLILICSLSSACFNPETEPPADESSGGATETDPSQSTDPTSGGPDSMSGNPTSMTTMGDTEGESTDSGPAACADGQGVCVAVPAGWSGPVAAAIAGGVTEPDCGGAETSIVAHGDIAGTDASCECECAPATGAECTDGRLVAWDDNTCSGSEVFSQTVYPDTGQGDPCNFMPQGDSMGTVPIEGRSHWTITTASRGGSCAPQASANIPTPSFQTSVAGCAVAELDGSCAGDEACWEAPSPPFEDGVCVWRPGDADCPTGFPSRTVWYRGDLVDTRACTECSCDEAVGSCPDSTVEIYEGYYCNDPVTTVPEGECGELCYGGADCNTYAVSALFLPGPAEASCAPSAAELTGELTAEDPVTFCCTG